MYDYIQQRLQERKNSRKYLNILSDEEKKAIETFAEQEGIVPIKKEELT